MGELYNQLSLTEILPDTEDSESFPLMTTSKYFDLSSLQNALNSSKLSENSVLSVFNTNARSLAKHISQFQALFESYHESGIVFDVLSFCETWLNDDLACLTSFNGYNSIFKHKSGCKEGGGIAAFLKNDIIYTVRDDLFFDESLLNQFDGLFIEIVNETSQNIILCILYRTPRFDSITLLTHHLSQKLDLMLSENKDIIIVGDLNIDLLKYQNHAATAEFLDHMLSVNLLPKITMPTRITEHSTTLIDHIFSNIDNHRCLPGTLPTDISDHFSNFIFVNSCNPSKHPPSTVSYRVINNQTLNNLNNSLRNCDWLETLQSK